MNGKKIGGWIVRGGIAAGGWENGRLDNFFLHGVGAICGTHLCCCLKLLMME